MNDDTIVYLSYTSLWVILSPMVQKVWVKRPYNQHFLTNPSNYRWRDVV